MMHSPEQIKELCANWCKAVQRPGGGLAIGGRQSEQYRLLNNGIQFHELNFEQLVASIDGLTNVLLLPGLNTVVDQDHFGLWSWCAEVILYRDTKLFEGRDDEIKKLFETCIRASLAHCRKPPSSKEEWQKQAALEEQLPHQVRFFLQESSLVLAYLSFPLLESISKKLCRKYVDMSGGIIAKFTVPNRSGGIREYDPSGRWNQRQCSSLRDLLFLIYNDVGNLALKNALTEFRVHVSTLDGSEDPFDVIYKWRNQSLHGTTSFNTIGGTLLNLALLVLVHQLADRYSRLRDEVLKKCKWEAQIGHKSPFSFYPPY